MAKTTKKEGAAATKKTPAVKSTQGSKPEAAKRTMSQHASDASGDSANAKAPMKVAGTRASRPKVPDAEADATATKPTKRVSAESKPRPARRDPVRSDVGITTQSSDEPVTRLVEESALMFEQVSDVLEGPTTDQIAERAYHLFLERGCQHGRDMEDWLEAERQLTGTHG